MRDSNVANTTKESAQAEFSHGLLDFYTNGNVCKQVDLARSPS